MRLSEIAARLNCVLNGDGNTEITGIIGIDEAAAGHLTFVSNAKYAAKAKTTKASAVIVSSDFPDIPAATLRTTNPYLAFARAVELFYNAPKPAAGIDPTARIATSAKIGEGSAIGP